MADNFKPTKCSRKCKVRKNTGHTLAKTMNIRLFNPHQKDIVTGYDWKPLITATCVLCEAYNMNSKLWNFPSKRTVSVSVVPDCSASFCIENGHFATVTLLKHSDESFALECASRAQKLKKTMQIRI